MFDKVRVCYTLMEWYEHYVVVLVEIGDLIRLIGIDLNDGMGLKSN